MFEEKDLNQGPSAYQPNALQLGQISSQNLSKPGRHLYSWQQAMDEHLVLTYSRPKKLRGSTDLLQAKETERDV